MTSIWRNGLLSHKRASKLQHLSVAMEEIQARRANKIIPGARPLHDYVNLYFCARNPMLYRLLSQHVELCIVRVHLAVLDLPQVVITDRNASSDWVGFFPSPAGLARLDGELIFAEYWVHPDDPVGTMKHKSIKCAEVLVPDRVDPRYLGGAYVSCPQAQDAFQATGVPLSVTIDRHLFFM